MSFSSCFWTRARLSHTETPGKPIPASERALGPPDRLSLPHEHDGWDPDTSPVRISTSGQNRTRMNSCCRGKGVRNHACPQMRLQPKLSSVTLEITIRK